MTHDRHAETGLLVGHNSVLRIASLVGDAKRTASNGDAIHRDESTLDSGLQTIATHDRREAEKTIKLTVLDRVTITVDASIHKGESLVVESRVEDEDVVLRHAITLTTETSEFLEGEVARERVRGCDARLVEEITELTGDILDDALLASLDKRIEVSTRRHIELVDRVDRKRGLRSIRQSDVSPSDRAILRFKIIIRNGECGQVTSSSNRHLDVGTSRFKFIAVVSRESLPDVYGRTDCNEGLVSSADDIRVSKGHFIFPLIRLCICLSVYRRFSLQVSCTGRDHPDISAAAQMLRVLRSAERPERFSVTQELMHT